MDFRHTEVLKLLSIYRQYECLWNCFSPDYKQPDMKKSAWIELSIHFGKEVDELKKKMKHLRNCYSAERKKVEASKNKHGIPTYEPRLYYYQQMDFLAPVVSLRKYSEQENNDDPLGESKGSSPKHDSTFSDRKRQRMDSSDAESDRASSHAELRTTKVPLDSDDSLSMIQIEPKPIKRRLLVNDVLKEQTQKVTKSHTRSCKEDTFCAMLCSELKLLKSEETYDNVTSEIFTAVKNAKIAERQRNYQTDIESKSFNRN
ncbi:PREDICTED: uncharacterized protein LOC108972463 [Bactrocera latifrons]|uniref:MADF domain-containing protein n=1 Tax=Bactrocera latifrons TaxID=174628 RepID=A0A0K8UA25_BACLA|nr:PREDICTED: uncharacterized protein LOC108972463 [Bactrocera latifrons]